MRVLVTGARGFIGTHLARRLTADRCQVIAVRGPEYAEVTAGADVVFHLASTPMDPAVSDGDHARVIVHGMLRLLERLRAARPGRLIVTGSAAEYGSGAGWRETDAPRPDTVFGIFKRAAGEMALASGIPAVHLRLFTPFGPGEADKRLIPSVILAALEGRPVRLRSSGNQQRDYFYIADAVEALIAAARAPERDVAGKVINICSGSPRRVIDAARTVLRLMGKPETVETEGGEAAALEQCSGDPSRAAALLGWRAQIDFEEGVRRSIRWLENRYASHR